MIHNQFSLAFLVSVSLLFCGCTTHEGTGNASSADAKPRSRSLDMVDVYVASMRNDLSRGKVGIITDVMHLSDEEAKVFWPIYQEYETELFDLGDQRVEGIRKFASDARSGKLNNAEASRLATAYFDYEGKRLELLRNYHGIIAEKVSPVRAAQFTQIEHRVGTVVDLLIASELPLINSATAPR